MQRVFIVFSLLLFFINSNAQDGSALNDLFSAKCEAEFKMEYINLSNRWVTEKAALNQKYGNSFTNAEAAAKKREEDAIDSRYRSAEKDIDMRVKQCINNAKEEWENNKKRVRQELEKKQKEEQAAQKRAEQEARNKQIEQHNREIAAYNAKIREQNRIEAAKRAEERRQAEIKKREEGIVAPMQGRTDNITKTFKDGVTTNQERAEDIKNRTNLADKAKKNSENPKVQGIRINPELLNGETKSVETDDINIPEEDLSDLIKKRDELKAKLKQLEESNRKQNDGK